VGDHCSLVIIPRLKPIARSSLDYSGLLIDDHPIQPANISEILVDTSPFGSWLKYENKTRSLTGEPPDSLGTLKLSPLSVKITTSFHQQIRTNVSVAVVPSFFSAETFEDLRVTPGQTVNFSLGSFLSGRTALGSPSDVNLTATFEPQNSNNFLAFDNKTMLLSGSIPLTFEANPIKVTFTAFSRVTHSTSHANLNLYLDQGSNASSPTSAEKNAKSHVLIGIAIAFGIIGGLLLLVALVAIFRRCVRNKDSARESEEGRRGLSGDEEHWHGFGAVEKRGPSQSEGVLVSLSDSIRRFGSTTLDRMRLGASENSFRSPPPHSDLVLSPGGSSMKKAEFVGKLRDAVRVVSDKYTSVSRRMRSSKSRPRLVIGLPQPASGNQITPPFATSILANPPPSLSLGGSPSSSIPESIPTRRADFAPPKNPSPRQTSLLSSTRGIGPSVNYEHDSPRSASDRSSIESHTQKAVVQTARAMSVRSGHSVSVSYPSQTLAGGGRPRLVPFTSSSRVPVPRIPPGDNGNLTADYGSPAGLKRIASLSAEIEGKGSREEDLGSYVRAFGMDPPDNAVPSFSSLVSSQASVTTKSRPARFLARIGEKFLFAIHVAEMSETVDVRLVSGEQLPRFIHVNRMGGNKKNVVQLWGLPAIGDEGELELGIYTSNRGGCIGRAIMEVVSKA
jgi:axial budding pattern protein 2